MNRKRIGRRAIALAVAFALVLFPSNRLFTTDMTFTAYADGIEQETSDGEVGGGEIGDGELGGDGEIGDDGELGGDGEIGGGEIIDDDETDDGEIIDGDETDDESPMPNDGMLGEIPDISIRQLLFNAIFGEGFTYGDADMQAAVEGYILSGMEDDFVELVYDWTLEHASVEPLHWFEYLLQAMDYPVLTYEEDTSIGPELTDDEANEYLQSIGMKPFGVLQNAAVFAVANYAARGFMSDELSSTVYAESASGLIENFSKTARPVDDSFRTYEISLDLTVGKHPYPIPGSSKPVDVVLVIDRSGSMSSNKVRYEGREVTRMDAVKAISTTLIGQIMEANAENRVGIVSFSDSAAQDIGLTARGSRLDGYEQLYTGNLGWVSYRNGSLGSSSVYGFPVSNIPAGTQLYYYNSSTGGYTLVRANASVGNRLGNYFSQTSSNATHFVPSYAGLNSGNSTPFYVASAGTGEYSGIKSVSDKLKSLSANGYTNIQGGIIEGYKLLSQSSAENRIMILLTDGEANRRTPNNSTNPWDKVNIRSGIIPSGGSPNDVKAAMLEGQWTVEQGIDLFAVGFSTASLPLERTTWSLSDTGKYRGQSQSTVSSALLSQHEGSRRDDRYFTTNTASGLEDIFNKIADEIITVDVVSDVEVTDVFSQAVVDNFDLGAFTGGNPAGAITFTGTAENGSPITVTPTVTYSDNGLVIKADSLAAGSYRISFELTVLPGKYPEGCVELETNVSAGVKYNYLEYSEDGKPIDKKGERNISSSPTVDVPPLITLELADDGVAYIGTEYRLTGRMNVPDATALGQYRIPDTWAAYYSGVKSASILLNGSPCAVSANSPTPIDVTVAKGRVQYRLTGDYKVSPNKYQLIYGDSAAVTVLGVEGALIYNLTGDNGGNGYKPVSKGLFDILTNYGNGSMHVGLEPGGSRSYTVREDLGAIKATAYVPYGYTQTTDVTGAGITLTDAIVSAAGSYEEAQKILNGADETAKDALEDAIKKSLTVSVNVVVKRPYSPWFRDWAWKSKQGFESEVQSL